MARNRASMREGPLAELFRATEAAQKQSKGGEAQQQLPTEPEQPQPVAVEEPPVSPTPIRAVAPAPDPEPASPSAANGRSRAGSTRCPSSPHGSSARVTPPRTSRRCASSVSAAPA